MLFAVEKKRVSKRKRGGFEGIARGADFFRKKRVPRTPELKENVDTTPEFPRPGQGVYTTSK